MYPEHIMLLLDLLHLHMHIGLQNLSFRAKVRISKRTSYSWLWKIALLLWYTLLSSSSASVISNSHGTAQRDESSEDATRPWSRCEGLEMALCARALGGAQRLICESLANKDSVQQYSLYLSSSLSLPSLSHWTEPNKTESSRITALSVYVPHYVVRRRERALGIFFFILFTLFILF